MKSERICRNQQDQNEYKKRLKEESRMIYGIEKCYASHKPYKGLIASHINFACWTMTLLPSMI